MIVIAMVSWLLLMFLPRRMVLDIIIQRSRQLVTFFSRNILFE